MEGHIYSDVEGHEMMNYLLLNGDIRGQDYQTCDETPKWKTRAVCDVPAVPKADFENKNILQKRKLVFGTFRDRIVGRCKARIVTCGKKIIQRLWVHSLVYVICSNFDMSWQNNMTGFFTLENNVLAANFSPRMILLHLFLYVSCVSVCCIL